MNLYRVADDEYEYYVFAYDMPEAIKLWMEEIADREGIEVSAAGDPTSATCVTDVHSILTRSTMPSLVRLIAPDVERFVQVGPGQMIVDGDVLYVEAAIDGRRYAVAKMNGNRRWLLQDDLKTASNGVVLLSGFADLAEAADVGFATLAVM